LEDDVTSTAPEHDSQAVAVGNNEDEEPYESRGPPEPGASQAAAEKARRAAAEKARKEAEKAAAAAAKKAAKR